MGAQKAVRWLTWIVWTVNLIICGVYSTAAIWTFKLLLKAGSNHGWASRYGLPVSCILGTILADTWVILSFFVLLSHGFANSPLGYGFMLGTALHTSVFMLMAGLMLNGSNDWASSLTKSGKYTTLDYNVYVAAYIMSYILCGVFLVLFLALLGVRRTLSGTDTSEQKPLRANMHVNSSAPSEVVAATKKKSAWTFGSSAPVATTPPLPVSQKPSRTALQYDAPPAKSAGLFSKHVGSLKKETGMTGPSKGGAWA